jgi:antitoxin YefM
MKLNISTDIIPIGEFKSQMTRWLNTAKNTGHPLIITQNGKPAAVVLSPEEFDKMKYTERFMNSVNQGLSDINSGDYLDTEQLKSELKKRRLARKPV